MTSTVVADRAVEPAESDAQIDAAARAVINGLRPLALKRLTEMYRPAVGRFVFRERLNGDRLTDEGVSGRYTAITLIGLATEASATATSILSGDAPDVVCKQLVAAASADTGLGDRALLCWAARAVGCDAHDEALDALLSMESGSLQSPTVDLAWAVTALCGESSSRAREVRDRLARGLVQRYSDQARCFPHGGDGWRGLRGHVACFADQVYPILALSQYAALSANDRALAVARATADYICRQQGEQGQWWWHYHARVGTMVERYPVYSVHQHAMAPMALAALERVSGASYRRWVSRGIEWLRAAPELGGGSLIDTDRAVIWRKVARREPAKMSRYLQAAVTRLHPSLTWPRLDHWFPPSAIDFECRSYELGWFLYAWPPPGKPEAR